MEFFNAHFGEMLIAACTVGLSAISGYIVMKIAVAKIQVGQVAEEKAREMFQKWEMEARTKLENKVDRHTENTDIHFHRRAGDPSGLWPTFGG